MESFDAIAPPAPSYQVRKSKGELMALPVPAETYVRQNIWQLESSGPWDPYSLAYANAVGEMRGRALEDPTSWAYQSAIHGSYIDPPKEGWNMCQHRSWFFLPWHRMYIFCFEQIVRSIVIEQGGPSDWALPFWDWTMNRALPPAFRTETLPDGSANPLYSTHRAPGVNDGALLPAGAVDTRYAFSFTTFTSPQSLHEGFGGGEEGPVHFGSLLGALENQPHNLIHGLLGGPLTKPDCEEGWMSDANCAAGDPVFWLHHAMIDRLWSRWLDLGGTRTNPTDPGWLYQEFGFFGPDGQAVSGLVAEARQTRDLHYRYSDDPPPVARPLTMVAEPAPTPVPETVEAVSPELTPPKSVELDTTPSTVSLELSDDASPTVERLRQAPATQAPSVYLTLQDVQAERDPGIVYAVYLNQPGAEDASDEHSEHFVGHLSFFGLGHEHEGQHHEHEGVGLTYVFDITSLIPQLEDRGGWDPTKTDVTFVPTGLVPPEGEGPPIPSYEPEEGSVPTVYLGRVSLHSE